MVQQKCYRLRVSSPHSSPVWLHPSVWQQRSRTENVGGSLTGSEFVFQLRSAPAAQTGAERCSVTSALQKVISVHFRKPTHFLILPTDQQSVLQRVWGPHRKLIFTVPHAQRCTETTHLALLSVFLCFLHNPITLPQFTAWSQESNGEALLRARSRPCMLYLLHIILWVQPQAGGYRKWKRLVWKGHWALL